MNPLAVLHLTGGTGSFHCGTCARDTALVAALRRLGHDARLVPLYLPVVSDEPGECAVEPLFLGGVNLYLQEHAAPFRHTPAWVDRLLDSPPVLSVAARRAGATRAESLGAMTRSMLEGEEGHLRKEVERLAAWLAERERLDVVCLSNGLLLGLAPAIRRAGIRVVCSLQGEDAFLDALPEPDREACWRLVAERAAGVDALVAVSGYYRRRMAERLGLDEELIDLVPNGITLEGYPDEPAAAPEPPVVGFFARMGPEKGLHVLVEAFAILRRRPEHASLRLRIGGACTDGDRDYVERQRARLHQLGLDGAVELAPNLDREQKIAFLRGLSVFSVPAGYGEAFGLYVLEANAAGVPVVEPRHGGFPEILARTGGGVLCERDDPESLAAAIAGLLAEPERRRALGERGRAAVAREFSAERMATDFARVLADVVAA